MAGDYDEAIAYLDPARRSGDEDSPGALGGYQAEFPEDVLKRVDLAEMFTGFDSLAELKEWFEDAAGGGKAIVIHGGDFHRDWGWLALALPG